MSLTMIEAVIKVVFFTVLAIFVLANAAILVFLTEAGLVILFAVAFITVIVTFSGTALLAMNFLYPETITFTGLVDLIVLVVLSSFSSMLLFLWAEDLMAETLGRSGFDEPWTEIGFVGVHGIVTALLLTLVARFMPGVELVVGAALAAGLTGAFGFYFAELIFVHSRSAGTEEMTVMEFSLEDEED